ncbi:MAG TPA: DMT family transporter [Flavobacteriales bacterium]|nr:DMT family transporter [Flavobacteriales bacterium]
MSRTLVAHIALFTVNLIYGVNYVVAKGLMPEVIGPSGFILLRVLGAGTLYWLLRAFRPEPVASQDLFRLFLCGVFGVALNQLMFFNGLMRTTPINASIIMVATPILVLVMSGLLLGERITWTKTAGVALGAAGALTLIFLKPQGTRAGASTLGDLYILINASSFAIYLVVVKPLMSKYSAITVMAWSFLVGVLLVTPFGWNELARVEWRVLSLPVWSAMTFVVVMVTFAAYLLNTWALGEVNATVVGTYIYMQPVLAAVFTWAFMRLGPERLGIPGEYASALGWPQLVCAAAIFTGVHLVSRTTADR